MLADKVQSLTDSIEKERKLRLLAEQRAQDASLRVDVLSSYFNEKEQEYDRCITFVHYICSLLLAVEAFTRHHDLLSSSVRQRFSLICCHYGMLINR